MVDTKKEQEREELHRAIWAIADDLRGAVDGWDFKSYVLGTMFYRYISENIASYINQGEIDAGNPDFRYKDMSDAEAEQAREGLVQEKGFFILPSELFCNVRAKAANDENLNETLETVFRHIEESAKGSSSEGQFAGLFDDYDVNSNKLGATVAKRNEKLVKLLNGVADMNLGDVKEHDIDAFGDAYEYLMTMYASNAGKSGGEFFTPADVSELLTRLGTVGKKEINKVYDPACGSGSLLLKAEKVLGRDAVRNGFFGQEINITTYNLCRINMFLHDIEFDKFDIACEDTLTNPQHWDDEPFELIVSNPPYSIKWAGDENPLLINDPRFAPAGVLAPKSKADLAFIMHSLAWLASNGTAAIVCFPGIMYRGGAEQKIRKYLVDNNFIDCIIQLPSNLFFGTSIATCIMVLKKGKTDNKVLFIDASSECVKVTNNNKLTPENINKIVDTFAQRAEEAHFSHLAEYSEVQENDYNLSVSTYVEAKDTREKIDIVKLNAEALVEAMTVQLDRLSAASTDILEMMEAVPDLVNIVRYGNVRDLDFSKVGDMLEAMIARILAGGVLVCINIDEEAAGDLLNKLVATDYALSILNREELNLMWRNFIGQVRSSANVHPLLSGYATRLLNDKGEISAEEMETTLSFYSSVGNAPADMAYWFEGFLRSSGSILLLDDRLWNLVNNWVCSQDKETFMELLPVLRRTFSEFTSAERRKLGEKARRTDSTGTSSAVGASVTENECLNREEAKKVIPVIRQLLGLETK